MELNESFSKYSYVLKLEKGKKRDFVLVGLKNNPGDTVEWFANGLGPIWYGTGDDTGLVGKWSCEWNFLDSAGNNHGTQTGGVKITTGVKGRACSFDGSNDRINLTSFISVDDVNN